MLRLHLVLTVLVCGACGGGDSGSPDAGGGGGADGGGEDDAAIDGGAADCDSGRADNILVNGGFDELDDAGTFAESWRNLDGNPDGAIVLVDDPVQCGSRALQWQIEAAGDGYEYFVIQSGIDPALLEPGVRYEIAGWYRASSVEGEEISFNYIVRGDGDEPNIGNDWDNTHPTVAETWERFAWEFTIPADASPPNYSVYLHLIKYTGDQLLLQVDDVSLHPAM